MATKAPPLVPARKVARQPSAETRCSGATLAARRDSKLPSLILHYVWVRMHPFSVALIQGAACGGRFGSL
jgi:hypothetical protein